MAISLEITRFAMTGLSGTSLAAEDAWGGVWSRIAWRQYAVFWKPPSRSAACDITTALRNC